MIGAKQSDSLEIVLDETTNYVVCFDPLDGAGNVDAGIPTGTIIGKAASYPYLVIETRLECSSQNWHMLSVLALLGIFEHDDTCEVNFETIGDDDAAEKEARCLANTLQPGTNLVAAAYCLYSSSTILTLTLGNGVFMFTLDESIGEFILAKPNVRIPESSSIYSFNEAYMDLWDEPLRWVVEGWREGSGASGRRFSTRYIGSMVADVHRTLLYGGVFGYPGDSRNPNGKLRLLYEAAPMSMIMEEAGGLSTTGTQRIMEITPEAVHQRVPVVMGSKKDVIEVMDAYTTYYYEPVSSKTAETAA
jgi:fructose-1,6-bisphosphatase I